MPFLVLFQPVKFFTRLAFFSILIIISSSCALLLLNGHLSLGSYQAQSQTFTCKLPGGALSTSLDIKDRRNELGETATFSLDIGLLWRIDHLLIGAHKLAAVGNINDRRQQLDVAKENYMSLYLAQNADQVEVEWEQYVIVDDVEVLLTKTYVKWGDKEENREVLFSVDGDYLNVIHFAQNVSSKLQTFTTGATGFYKSCDFKI